MFKKLGIMLAITVISASFVFAQIGMGSSQATKAVTSTVTTTAKVEALNTDDAKEMPKAPANFKADFVGQVVSVEKLILSGDGKVNTKTAKELLTYGKPIGFLSNGTVYFIYDAGGNFAGNKLAVVADAAKVGIAGKVKTIKGLKYIIANGIYAM